MRRKALKEKNRKSLFIGLWGLAREVFKTQNAPSGRTGCDSLLWAEVEGQISSQRRFQLCSSF